MGKTRKAGGAGGRVRRTHSALTGFGQAHVGQTGIGGYRAWTLRVLTSVALRASLTAVHDASTSDPAIDRDRATAPRAEDVRHARLPLAIAFPTVKFLVQARLPPSIALVRVPHMDPLAWLLGAAAVSMYGYRRPTEVFRLALYARLRAGGLRRHRRTLPDATVHYWRGGRGAPLVFVHGFGTEAAINWYAQLLPFRGAYDVLAPDLPGFGRSERCLDTNCIALQVRCLRTLLDDLGVDRVSLVGHSMGGWISLAFAAAHPERVERLVVVDAAGLRFEPDLHLERALLPDTIDDVRMLIRANFLGAPRLPAFVLRDVLRVAKRDAVGRTELLRRLVYGSEHVDERLDAIRAPTLVVWGAEDPLTPLALGERVAASVGGARLVVFPDCAHSPNVERPERFNDLLRGFLREAHVVAGAAEVAAAVG